MMYCKINSVIYKHTLCAVNTQWLRGGRQDCKTGIEAERVSRMSFTDRQTISDRLPHLAHIPSSEVEIKSAEVAIQWRNIYSEIIVACIYPSPRPPAQQPPPPSGPGPYSLPRPYDHTQTHTTAGRTPLDEWSARPRDLCLTTHNTDNKHPCPRRDSNPRSH